MDSYVYSVGTIAGSMLIGLIVFAGSSTGRSTSMSIWARFDGRPAGPGGDPENAHIYDASLLNWRLQRRKRGRSVLDEVSS
ncbi:MAG: hypothetical protein R2851_09070 [Caldilineaceae bacterium]